MEETKVKLYAMTHKAFSVPTDSLYQAVWVGAALQQKEIDESIYLRDDRGDNISNQNPYYSELTGLYWVWKNIKDQDIVGICHYRRYLQNAAGKLFTQEQIVQILSHYDVMTTKKVILDHSYFEGFAGKHNQEDLITTGEVIRKLCPAYYEDYLYYVNHSETYFGNMMICKKELLNQYAAWLFGILFEVQKRIQIQNYNDYQKRVFGFISELLLMVYLKHHQLRIYECDVAVIGEKKETKETKDIIAEYLLKGDILGAKKYFLEIYQKRPDILMEASDTKGELKLCMQILVTLDMEAQIESQMKEKQMVKQCYILEELLAQYRMLNRVVQHLIFDKMSRDDIEVILNKKFSNISYRIALKIACPYDIKKQEHFYQKLLSMI